MTLVLNVSRFSTWFFHRADNSSATHYIIMAWPHVSRRDFFWGVKPVENLETFSVNDTFVLHCNKDVLYIAFVFQILPKEAVVAEELAAQLKSKRRTKRELQQSEMKIVRVLKSFIMYEKRHVVVRASPSKVELPKWVPICSLCATKYIKPNFNITFESLLQIRNCY